MPSSCSESGRPALQQWLRLPAGKVENSLWHSAFKEAHTCFFPAQWYRFNIACRDHQGSNFKSCGWRAVSSRSPHHPQEVLLAQFSLHMRNGGLKPNSFHFQLRHLWWIPIEKKNWSSWFVEKYFSIEKINENRGSRVQTPLWHSSFKKTKCFFPAHSWRFNIVGSLCVREVACSASDR